MEGDDARVLYLFPMLDKGSGPRVRKGLLGEVDELTSAKKWIGASAREQKLRRDGRTVYSKRQGIHVEF